MTIESIDDGDFVIRIRPTEVDGHWTGEIDISIISQANNPLDDEGYTQMMHFCKMMCATVPIMERDEVVDKEEEDMLYDNDDSDIIVTKEDGNVVHLSFGSKTKGSA